MSYVLTLSFFDSTSPAVGLFSSPLLPKTPTFLEPKLDIKLRSVQSKLCLPQSFFHSPLPVHRKLDTINLIPPPLNSYQQQQQQQIEQEQQQASTSSRPRIYSESTIDFIPPSIATADLYLSSSKAQKATLDFRFGPLILDWIDNPQPLLPMSSPPTSPNLISASTSNIGSPPPINRILETSGTTDLYWGSLHLQTTRDSGISTGTSSSTSNEKEKKKQVQQPGGDGRVMGMISVPRNLTAAAILRFIQPALESISQIRMLKDSNPSRMMVILKFKTSADAHEFKFIYNSKLYNPESNESEVCHVVSISEIKLKSITTPPYTFPYSSDLESNSPNDLIELPTCTVCLERMDSSVTGGLIQILCLHAFHCNCLLKWGDSTCPICRATNYRTTVNRKSSPEEASKCTVCDSGSNLWCCMICGHLGCGRYQGGHAHSHFTESYHTFALELETQRIWDYSGDSYVHRLIQSKTDGKFVELPSSHSSLSKNEEKGGKGGPDEKDEASMEKIEEMGAEYGVIMTSALENQRYYFEEELARLEDQANTFKKKWTETLDLVGTVKKERLEDQELVKKVEKEKELLKIKLDADFKKGVEVETLRRKEKADALKVKKEIEKELLAEKAVTASLTENLRHLTAEVEKTNAETQTVRAEVEELKEGMRDMMFALSARDQIAEAGGGDMAGGDISLPPTPAPTISSSSARRKKKK